MLPKGVLSSLCRSHILIKKKVTPACVICKLLICNEGGGTTPEKSQHVHVTIPCVLMCLDWQPWGQGTRAEIWPQMYECAIIFYFWHMHTESKCTFDMFTISMCSKAKARLPCFPMLALKKTPTTTHAQNYGQPSAEVTYPQGHQSGHIWRN